jgi:transcriptional regulator with XRE-family HTH domain
MEINVGKKLLFARKKAGLTQTKAALLISNDQIDPVFVLSPGQLSTYESGSVNVPANKFFKILHVYQRIMDAA